MSAYSPPTRRIPSCSSDYPQCEAKAHTLFPLPSHQIKTQNLSFLKRHRQIFSFRVLKRQFLLPFAQKQMKTLSVFAVALHPEGVDRNFVLLRRGGVVFWSPSTRRAWIEMPAPVRNQIRSTPSPSARRAWIEIGATYSEEIRTLNVALHPEGVDRNRDKGHYAFSCDVALHPEGVDRNIASPPFTVTTLVALHPEGVDRNSRSSSSISAQMCRPPPGGRG